MKQLVLAALALSLSPQVKHIPLYTTNISFTTNQSDALMLNIQPAPTSSREMVEISTGAVFCRVVLESNGETACFIWSREYIDFLKFAIRTDRRITPVDPYEGPLHIQANGLNIHSTDAAAWLHYVEILQYPQLNHIRAPWEPAEMKLPPEKGQPILSTRSARDQRIRFSNGWRRKTRATAAVQIMKPRSSIFTWIVKRGELR